MAAPVITAPALRSSELVPAPGRVDVWRVSLTGDVRACHSFLSAEDRARLAGRHGERRTHFVRSHGSLRQIVSCYVGGSSSDAELRCAYGVAPRARGGVHVSLAHCEQIALVAVAGAPVGIDVEALAAVDDDLDDLAEFALTSDEFAAFCQMPPRARPAAFLRLWTRKEAAMKARGLELGDALLSNFPVAAERLGELALADIETVHDVGMVASVALQGPDLRVTGPGRGAHLAATSGLGRAPVSHP